MKSSVRKRVLDLPTLQTAWELDILRMPLSVPDVDIAGVVVIVDATSGRVRVAAPLVRGEGTFAIVWKALVEPTDGKPGRPLSIRCTDHDVCRELKAELREVPIRVELVPEVPQALAAANGLFAHLVPPTSPGVTVDLPLWSAALTELCVMAPWEVLCDSVTFRFEGAPDLDEAVLVVLGLAGEQRGVVLYQTEGSYERFLEYVASQAPSALHDVVALQAYLDPADELEPSEREACASLGLELPGGLLPRVGLMAHGEFRPVDADGQRALLAAIQATIALCRDGVHAIDAAPQQRHVDTCLGRLLVRSTPSTRGVAPPPSLIDADHAVLAGFLDALDDPTAPALPTFVLKMTKRDAVQARNILACVDSVELRVDDHGNRFLAYGGGVLLGSLGLIPRLDPKFAASDRLQLILSGGGAQRARLFAKDIQHVRVVPMRRHAAMSTPPAPVADPIFAQPAGQWPKVSETLVAFAESVTGHTLRRLTTRQAEQTLKVAAAVWCAVVLADYKGQPVMLEEVRRLAGESLVLVDALVQVKRERFAGDPRIIVLGEVQVKGGVLNVKAHATL